MRIKNLLKFSLLTIIFSCSNIENNLDRTVITFWHTHNKEETSTLEDIIKSYEKKNLNIKVELQQIPFSDAQNKYKTVAQAGNAPDLFRAEIAWDSTICIFRLFNGNR
ncbi:MAG: hypothetical protein KatS3mg068_2448 [Candidatus Sericytochromatia bacterium]|nr:MAG: hypothetical protein KatS3mg068_2448 [Candidatus Sericytochromatia bacterium]